MQRVPKFDILSEPLANNKIHSRGNAAVGDFPTLDLNLSIGLSSFAESDIMTARVRWPGNFGVVACHIDTSQQDLGFAPIWQDALSFFSSKRFCITLFHLLIELPRCADYCSSVDSGVVSVGDFASGLSELRIIPGRTWLVQLPVLVKVCEFTMPNISLVPL